MLAIHQLGRVPLAGLCCAVLTVLSSCTLLHADRVTVSLISLYSHAECIAPVYEPPYHHIPTWNETITLSPGLIVTVEGEGFVHGGVVVVYSHGTAQRVVADPPLYVYPYDVRIDRQSGRLYVVASGLAGGLWRRTVLYEYDLVERTLLHEVDVDRDSLPPRCPPRANDAANPTAPKGVLSHGATGDIAARPNQ